MQLLLDGDQASNNGNWQWIASVGVDPQPAFRRVYKPVCSSSDSTRTAGMSGASCRSWPGCRTAAWLSRGGCRRRSSSGRAAASGQDYPAPIVDHKVARLAALDRYRAAAVTGGRVSSGRHERGRS